MHVIYFKTSNATFVLRDQRILEKNFATKTYYINNSSRLVYSLSIIKLTIYLLFKGRNADVYFTRFSDWHTAIIAFFKIIYRKKLLIVVGGYDVAAIPAIGYGLHLHRIRSRFARYTMRNATYLLPVSSSLIRYENSFVTSGKVQGGIMHFVPNLKAQIEVVNNGFDGEFWHKKVGIKKENIVLTVALIENIRGYKLKGIDNFIRAAKMLPGTTFVAVGLTTELLGKVADNWPQNLVVCSKIEPETLVDWYSRAKVFCLFSLSEGMPNVLCEAMLCECIPVGTRVTSIPEIIGDTGFLVDTNCIEDYVAKTKLALNADAEFGKKARSRILQHYSLQQRESKIVNLIRS